MYRRAYIIGIGAYIIMLALSIVFYKERTIFLDMAFNLFYIIKNYGFAIQLYRFGDCISQLPPLIAAKAGLPLNEIFGVYSAGFVIYYFAAYFICGSILKRYDFALVILLQNILFASDTFYWMLSQLPQATAILIVLFAFIANKQMESIKAPAWALLLSALITVIFFHPLIVFIMIFCIVFFMLSKKLQTDRRLLYSIAFIYFTGIVLKFFIFKTPYENHSMSGMKNFITLFPDYFSTFSNRRFLHNCLTKYYWIPLLFSGIVLFYIRAKKYKKLWFFVFFFIAYLGLVNISYPFAITPEFYIENIYLPLSIFIAFPFVFDLLPVLAKKKMAVPLVLLIVVTGSIRLYATHTTYAARLSYERKVLDKYGDKKVIIKATKADTDALLMLWGTPYEMLLLSASERHKPASVIIDDNPDKFKWSENLHNGMVVNWNVVLYKDLNPLYFHFTDTTSGYMIVK